MYLNKYPGHVVGFIGQYKFFWLVDTGAVRIEIYVRLILRVLHKCGSQVFVADGRRTGTQGTGELTVRIGSQDVSISVLVDDIEDSAILCMDFLSDVDAKIDLVQQQFPINGAALVAVRILNSSDKVQTIGAQIAISVAKPV